MLTSSPFDFVANNYDNDFSQTLIGKLQREQVYKIVKSDFEKHSGLKILELNCGTGIDAIWMAGFNHYVTATDASAKMIDIANKKAKSSKNITFIQLHFNQINASAFENKFDVIFSNFAGLNCASKPELEQLNNELKHMINDDGRLYLIMLGKYSWLEKLFFFLIGDKLKMNRRLRMDDAQLAPNISVKTWCYSSKEIAQIFTHFKVVKLKPIGLFIPPSYLEPLLKKNILLLPIIKFLEKTLGSFSFLSNYGDHIFLELKLKK